jgi:hypothetical protein
MRVVQIKPVRVWPSLGPQESAKGLQIFGLHEDVKVAVVPAAAQEVHCGGNPVVGVNGMIASMPM